MVEAAELLGINLDDIQLANNVHVEAEMELLGDSMTLQDKQHNFHKSPTKEDFAVVKEEGTDTSDSKTQDEYMMGGKDILKEVSIISEMEAFKDIKTMIDKETGKFMCDQCDYETHHLKIGYKHLQKKHNNKIFQCNNCRYKSKNKNHVQVHIESKHSGIRYDCGDCDFQSAHKKDVKRHKLAKHNDGVKPFSCDLCIYTAITTVFLRRHKIQKHNVECVKCDYCPYKAVTQRGLRIHTNNQHQTKI